MDKTDNEESKRVDVGQINSETIVSVSQKGIDRPFYFSEKDFEILLFIHDMKFATIHELYRKFFHITQKGFFSKSKWYARDRIQDLLRNSYLKVGKVDDKGMNYYIITSKALKALDEKHPMKIDLPGLTRSRICDMIWAKKGPDHGKKEIYPRRNHTAFAYG